MTVLGMTVLGVGGREGAGAEALLELAAKLLADHGRTLADVRVVATLDRKADHPGVRRLLATTGATLRTWPSEQLAEQPVTSPSARVASHVGTPSVAEAGVRAAGAVPTGSASADGWVVTCGEIEPDLMHHGDTEVAPGMLDFAVNVHAPEPPAFLQRALTDAIRDLARYPDPRAAEAAVAAAHGVPAESVLLTHGAAEAFTLVAQQPWRQPLVVHPQFTEPEAALRAAGHSPARLLLRPEEDFRLTRTPEGAADLVMVGNPTNPTSRLHLPDELESLRTQGRTLAVDEAFMDVVEDPARPEHSLVLTAAQAPEILVIRSLTKTWSLAGLRVGYVVAHPDTLAALARRRTPWPVSSLAAVAAAACLGDEGLAHARRVRTELPSQLAHLRDGLTGHGFRVVPDPRGPFVLARREDAAQVRESLRAQGIAVRRGDTFPGLDETWLRFAAREAAATDALMKSL